MALSTTVWIKLCFAIRLLSVALQQRVSFLRNNPLQGTFIFVENLCRFWQRFSLTWLPFFQVGCATSTSLSGSWLDSCLSVCLC